MTEEFKKRLLSIAYIATAFYALHDFSLYFVLSNFLSQYFSRVGLSIIFALSALASIFAANIFGKILRKYSNKKTLLFALLVQLAVTTVLAFSGHINVYGIAILTILRISILTLIWTSINVFIGEFSEHENVGSIRGTILTIYNLGAISTPFISAGIFNLFGYSSLFIISALSLLPIIYLTNRFFSHVKEPKYKRIGLREGVKTVFRNKDLRGVIASSFVLNSFYAVANIYLVLYLTQTIGIPLVLYLGLLVPITIIPFILIPYELGKYSDEIFGEKRAMMVGIFIMSIMLACIYVFDIKTQNIFVWITILFLARLGATITETENYAYFYKKVDGRNAGLISLFQNMVNVSFLFVSALGALLIDIFNIKLSFMFLIISLLGLFAILIIRKITDTEIKRRKIEEEKNKVREELTKEEKKKELEAEKEWKNKKEQIWT